MGFVFSVAPQVRAPQAHGIAHFLPVDPRSIRNFSLASNQASETVHFVTEPAMIRPTLAKISDESKIRNIALV